MKLTVLFDGLYWSAIVEQTDESKLRACKYIFGPEPKDHEILFFINNHMISLINQVSESINIKNNNLSTKINPKRLSRQVSREIKQEGFSEYAHEALQVELKKRKLESKKMSKEKKIEIKERKRSIAKEKAKLKHKGK